MCNNCSRQTKEQRRNCHWNSFYQKEFGAIPLRKEAEAITLSCEDLFGCTYDSCPRAFGPCRHCGLFQTFYMDRENCIMSNWDKWSFFCFGFGLCVCGDFQNVLWLFWHFTMWLTLLLQSNQYIWNCAHLLFLKALTHLHEPYHTLDLYLYSNQGSLLMTVVFFLCFYSDCQME